MFLFIDFVRVIQIVFTITITLCENATYFTDILSSETVVLDFLLKLLYTHADSNRVSIAIISIYDSLSVCVSAR